MEKLRKLTLTALSGGEAGDGIGNDTAAVRKAIDECSVKGGTVMLSPGTYGTGTLFMKSNVALHIFKGATLRDCSYGNYIPWRRVF
ncbi:MAG: hypothetical protein WCI43_04460 [Candidatus Firestonebacteria bacterium]